MTDFDPKSDWTLEEALRLAGVEVVSTQKSYMHHTVGHVHEVYRCGDGYHVTIAWHTGRTDNLGPKRPPRPEQCGYSKLEWETTLVERTKSVFHLMPDQHPNPCQPHLHPGSCPILPKGARALAPARR